MVQSRNSSAWCCSESDTEGARRDACRCSSAVLPAAVSPASATTTAHAHVQLLQYRFRVDRVIGDPASVSAAPGRRRLLPAFRQATVVRTGSAGRRSQGFGRISDRKRAAEPAASAAVAEETGGDSQAAAAAAAAGARQHLRAPRRPGDVPLHPARGAERLPHPAGRRRPARQRRRAPDADATTQRRRRPTLRLRRLSPLDARLRRVPARRRNLLPLSQALRYVYTPRSLLYNGEGFPAVAVRFSRSFVYYWV